MIINQLSEIMYLKQKIRQLTMENERLRFEKRVHPDIKLLSTMTEENYFPIGSDELETLKIANSWDLKLNSNCGQLQVKGISIGKETIGFKYFLKEPKTINKRHQIELFEESHLCFIGFLAEFWGSENA